MGFTPQQVDAMTFWELSACLNGYGIAHGVKGAGKTEALSKEQLKEMGVVGF